MKYVPLLMLRMKGLSSTVLIKHKSVPGKSMAPNANRASVPVIKPTAPDLNP